MEDPRLLYSGGTLGRAAAALPCLSLPSGSRMDGPPIGDGPREGLCAPPPGQAPSASPGADLTFVALCERPPQHGEL